MAVNPSAPRSSSDRLLEAAETGQPAGNGRVATLDDLRRGREVYATLPSGNVVKLRPPDMYVHALSGNLPSRLRSVGLDSDELQKKLTAQSETPEDKEAREAAADYFLYLIKLTIVQPDLTRVETLADLDAILLPADMNWLLQVATGQTDRDAEGKRLWGREPLDRWARFRELHRCPEDCPACDDLRGEFQVAPTLG